MQKRFGARCRCQGQWRPEVTSTVKRITMSKPLQRREVKHKTLSLAPLCLLRYNCIGLGIQKTSCFWAHFGCPLRNIPRWTCPYFGITPLRAANLPYCFQLLFLEDQLEHVSTPHQTSSSNSTLLSLTQAARIQDIQDAYPGRFVAYLMPGRSGCELRRFLVPSPFAKNIKTYQNISECSGLAFCWILIPTFKSSGRLPRHCHILW